MHKCSNFSPFLSTLVIVWFCFYNSHPHGYEGHLTVLLVCMFIKVNEVKHLFMCLSTICTFSLEECVFISFASFWIGFCCCYSILWVLYVIYSDFSASFQSDVFMLHRNEFSNVYYFAIFYVLCMYVCIGVDNFMYIVCVLCICICVFVNFRKLSLNFFLLSLAILNQRH